MPSPFPGMDPFIEFQSWDDFHAAFIHDIADELVPRVKPKYVVRRERRVYVEHDPDDPERFIIPDVTVAGRARPESVSTLEDSSAATLTAVEVTLPMPATKKEAFLTIRDRVTLEVVTVIELLSPANKRPGSDGRRIYLAKRDQVLESTASLVELDLLRGGQRLPTVQPLPPGDYYGFVCRAKRRPRAEVYAWTLRQPLPRVPVPLTADEEAPLDLQRLYAARFDRSGYDYSLSYDVPQEPPFSQGDAEWIASLLKSTDE
ncbi:MAG: DUF4058 family protein [Planctomycetales bacterium]